jgi:pyruvate dehydrogenase E2 component (dihydrolipoamide acetyltransferase)
MSISILMPALSPTMTEGNLVKWHKKEGDFLKAGDILAEIETDKATMEVEVVDEGILGKILIDAGTENVKINTPIALVLEDGEDSQTIAFNPSLPPVTQDPSAIKNRQNVEDTNVILFPEKQNLKERIIASPLARRIAREKNIDLSVLIGSGPKGRIIKHDVEKVLMTHPKSPEQFVEKKDSYHDIPVKGMRKIIAQRLTESKQTIPHFYLTVDCILDDLLSLRRSINESTLSKTKISVNDLIIRACALALQQAPDMRVTWHDTFVRQYISADISVAVSIEGGLVTPILREAEKKSISTISTEMKSLIEKAKAGKLMPEDYQGGILTLSNLGMYGIKNFQAIINPPQSSILAIGAAEERPSIHQGAIKIASIMNVTLSVDHRSVDGAVAAKFLTSFKELLENPLSLLI